MNSTGDVHENEIDQNGLPSGSGINTEDKNANVRPAPENRGAIPKVKTNNSASKKTTKVNNNIDDMPTANGPSKALSPLRRLNGYPSDTAHQSLTDIVSRDPTASATESHINSLKTILNSSSSIFEGFLSLPDLPATKKPQSTPVNSDESDSSSDTEILSVSDDGCIYTYKGDDAADLPSSFFNLVIPPLELDNRQQNRNCASSPEMDFLEMDFDPGPSGDLDSDGTSNIEPDNAVGLPLQANNVACLPSKCQDFYDISKPSCSGVPSNKLEAQKDPSRDRTLSTSNIERPSTLGNNLESCLERPSLNIVKPTAPVIKPVQNEIKMPWSCTLGERTRSVGRLRKFNKHHSPRGEILSPSDCTPLDIAGPVHSAIERQMIWTEKEACLKQITQIGPSSCGATAVLNVLNALRLPIPSVDVVQACVGTRMRANLAPLTDYLLSRSMAGCNHRDIMLGLHKVSNGRVYCKFFAMYPERVVDLYKWLSYWIKNGAVPIATLNLQKCEGNIPDSWHHQMIFGVGPEGIYLTNPMECVEASELWPQLSSQSVLLIQREDIISRFDYTRDLSDLVAITDTRWKDLNVVGQVAHVIRESRRETKLGFTNKSHVSIPAEYKAGITLAIDINSPAFKSLQQCPEMPLLHTDDAATALYL